MASETRDDAAGGPSHDRPGHDGRGRLFASRGVLIAAVLVTVMAVSLVIACFINDRTIEEARGTAVAEVVDTSFTRTVVRFNTQDGQVHIPPAGVLYPSGLETGQLVRVDYDARNPNLVRVAERTMTVSLLPVGSALAVTWAVLIPLYWGLRPSNEAWPGRTIGQIRI